MFTSNQIGIFNIFPSRIVILIQLRFSSSRYSSPEPSTSSLSLLFLDLSVPAPSIRGNILPSKDHSSHRKEQDGGPHKGRNPSQVGGSLIALQQGNNIGPGEEIPGGCAQLGKGGSQSSSRHKDQPGDNMGYDFVFYQDGNQ